MTGGQCDRRVCDRRVCDRRAGFYLPRNDLSVSAYVAKLHSMF